MSKISVQFILFSIEEAFDINHILDELDSEEEAEFSSGSGSDAGSVYGQSDTERTSSVNPTSDTDTSGLFLGIEEPIQLPIYTQFIQFNQAREAGNVPTSVGFQGSTYVNRPLSPTTQTSGSCPRKRITVPTTTNRPAKRVRM